MTTRIGILLFEDVDLLDVGGPYEVFLTASRLVERSGAPALFEVLTIGTEKRAFSSYGGMGLVPTHTVEDAGALDVIVIPGAIAIADVAARPALRKAIAHLVSHARLVSSVCTGAFLLGEAGVLYGRPWTTHWEDIAELARRLDSTDGVNARWVDSGDVVTAGGLSAGVDMALHLVERFADRELAIRTARQIDYAWDPDAGIVHNIP